MAAVNTAFRSVEELTREELNELKQNYVAETRDDPSYGELADSVRAGGLLLQYLEGRVNNGKDHPGRVVLFTVNKSTHNPLLRPAQGSYARPGT